VAAEHDEQQEQPERGGIGSIGGAMALLVVAWTAGLAAGPLKDNSFLTHLATGRIILQRGSVPTRDPYTFTAEGTSWTVQSWLASVAYAGAERLGGAFGLRLLVLVVFVAAGLLVWRLTGAASSVVARFSIAAVALFVATDVWSERPYMVGVIGLGVVWLALEGAVRPWMLVPILWVWANSHGSFPLSILLVLAVLTGAWLDRRLGRGSPEAVRTAVDVLKMVLVGTLLAAVGPLGVDVLLFPVKAITRADVLAEIVEWQAPAFTSPSERLFLLLVLATLAGLVRSGRWRTAIPALAFTGLAVTAQRNVAMATMVLVPCLAASVPPLGSLTSRSRPSVGPAVAAVLAAVAVLVIGSAVTAPLDTLGPYPARPIAWLEAVDEDGSGGKLASQDFVGNLLEVLDGGEARVFIDDRADMFPSDVFGDATDLLRGHPEWQAVLDRHGIDIVLWERNTPTASLLAASPSWQTVYSDTRWVIACRRETGCDELSR
jgi:hypothetical protein